MTARRILLLFLLLLPAFAPVSRPSLAAGANSEDSKAAPELELEETKQTFKKSKYKRIKRVKIKNKTFDLPNIQEGKK